MTDILDVLLQVRESEWEKDLTLFKKDDPYRLLHASLALNNLDQARTFYQEYLK